MQCIFSIFALCACLVEAQNGTWPWQTYRSSRMEPPSLNITKSGPTSPGYLFFVQNGIGARQYGAFIMSDDNELIWESNTPNDITNFRTQQLDGKPVLTFFSGTGLHKHRGYGYGIIQVLDESYESIYNVSLFGHSEGYQTLPEIDATQIISWIDLHESKITPDGTMLVTAKNVTQFDLTSVGGPQDGWVADSLFYEIDVKTNEILFRWSSLEHVDEIPLASGLSTYPLADLGRNQSYPWGYFHINSIENYADGSYLMNSRNFCSLYHIALNGSVEWTLNGRSGGDFTLRDGLSFCYQHDARILQENGNSIYVTIFNDDNDALHISTDQTTGILMILNTETWEATLSQEFIDPKDTNFVPMQGGLQVLDDNHVIIGYGVIPKIKEYTSNGSVVMTAQFGESENSVYSYRAYRSEWTGRPKTLPSVFACTDTATNQTVLYMSWLGATEHTFWTVYAGSDESKLFAVDQVARTGFETVSRIVGLAQYLRVEAQGLNITFGISAIISPQGAC